MYMKGIVSTSVSQEYKLENSNFYDYLAILKDNYTLNENVLLIQGPQFLFDAFNPEIIRMKGYYAYPPTGLQWLAESLSGRNLNIEILDLNYQLLKRIIEDDNFDHANWLDILGEYVERIDPSIVGVTAVNVNSNMFKPGYPFTDILRYLRNIDRSIIIAGGPLATDEHENFIEKDLCHFVVGKEGENKIRFLFDSIYKRNSKTIPTPGIYFEYDNIISQTAGPQDVVDPKGNLINTYNMIEIEDYNKVGSLNPYSRMVGQDVRFAAFQLNRGCKSRCKFCGVPDFMGKGIRHFPVNDLFEEIKFLVEAKNIRHFDVLDDAFLGDKVAARELLIKLVKLRDEYGITWSSNNGLTAISITNELLCLMRDSGCVGFRIGVESGNAALLRKMGKPANLQQLRKVGKMMNDFPEMFLGAYYIIGMFGSETFGEMMETFKFSSKIKLDWASFATFQVTSKKTTVTGELSPDAKEGGNFIPSRADVNRELADSEGVVLGTKIFELPEDLVPSFKQIKEIWFGFNLVANYINNKNLKEGGRPEKFVAWIEAIRIAHLQNPYMSLFAGLGHRLIGNSKFAENHITYTRNILKESKYWSDRFAQFALTELVINSPNDVEETKEALAILRKKYTKWIE